MIRWTLPVLAACQTATPYTGPVAEGIFGDLGEVLPSASPEQVATFDRGVEVANRRFRRADGLGPAFNVTFCASCHEKPVTGGSAGTYRNFLIAGVTTEEGEFFLGASSGFSVESGVVRMYYDGVDDEAHPVLPDDLDTIAQRNPIPFFGVGLLAELDEADILVHEDPDDLDGDGISGRPNYVYDAETGERFVGRFGMKAQTVSIEGFIRGPLFNHAGITSDPLTLEQRAALPVDSAGTSDSTARAFRRALFRMAQVAPAAAPLVDDDGVPDPELSTADLYDLVAFSMLTAAPKPSATTPASERGQAQFEAMGCASCHVPMLYSSKRKGGIPAYTDLLLHDMGPDLADGIAMAESTGSEFRTQPLWGVIATGPYLHDGRAGTLFEAIDAHGGEASSAASAFRAASNAEREDLYAFLATLGGAEQASAGLVAPNAPVPEPATWGGPYSPLNPTQTAAFVARRALFDTDFSAGQGKGGPRFNGDSCRACHFEPVIGGAGPNGVNVIRHGVLGEDGAYVRTSQETSVLHRFSAVPNTRVVPQQGTGIYELRNTPHVLGLALVEAIDEATLFAAADPDDSDGDGISGKVGRTDGGLVGRFGWKAQIGSVHEFVRDALHIELGLTVPFEPGRSFGSLQDNDAITDPEVPIEVVDDLTAWLASLAPPPRSADADSAEALAGAAVFEQVGCAACHTPSLPSAMGPVPLFSDLLLHEMLPPGSSGIEEGSATMTEFRTAPLWGLRDTAPYLHNGSADTLREAIVGHDGEARDSAAAFEELDEVDAEALLFFLGTL